MAMSLEKIEAIIDALRQERYRWTPVRRTYIPKKSGKMRPLGIPTWSDKAAARSHPRSFWRRTTSRSSARTPTASVPAEAVTPPWGRSPQHWRGVKWFIEGDISQCFDSLDHEVLLSILREKLHDNRFLRLIANLLTGWIPGGLELQRDAERSAARRRGQPDPLQYLPRPAGSVRRDGAPPGIQPRRPTEALPALHGATQRRTEQTDRRGSRRGHAPAPTGAADAFARPRRSRLPPALVRPVCGRLCATSAKTAPKGPPECVTVQPMRGGPSEPACRSRFQTTSGCCGQKPWS